MEDYASLSIIAELAVAFAGFAGVFVVLRHEAKGEWTHLERIRLVGLLTLSIPTAIFSLVPTGLGALFDNPAQVWRVSAACSGGVMFLIGIWLFPTFTKITNRIPTLAERRWTTRIARVMAILFVSALALYGTVASGFSQHHFSHYYFALLLQLLMCSVLFGRILLVRPPTFDDGIDEVEPSPEAER